jgi:SAM-dependent methyltransferase
MQPAKTEAYKLIRKYYEWESRDNDSYRDMYFSPHILERYEHQLRYRGIAREIRKYRVETGKMVDIGCGEGYYFKDYIKKFRTVIGLDISLNKLKRAGELQRVNKNIHRMCSNAETLPLQANSMNLVVCSELLEHLIEPGTAIDEIERILNPGGAAIISAPTWNNPGLWRAAPNQEKKVTINFHQAFEGHLWNFSTASFLRQVRTNRLKLVKIKGVSPLLSLLAARKKQGAKPLPGWGLALGKLLDKLLSCWPRAYIYSRYNIFVFRKEMG